MYYISVNCTDKSSYGKTTDSPCKSLKYVLSFLTSDVSQQYDMYYISLNGTDKSTCGKTADSACKSFKYVLGIYYNKTQLPKSGLSIITSKSLVINEELIVSSSIQWFTFLYVSYL